MWWWALLIMEGKRRLIGPFNDDVEARQKAQRFTNNFQLHEFPTVDENKATRMLKAKLESTERMSHG